MKVGYAQTVITPPLDRPVYLAGFGRNRRAQTIHDDLYARALALQEGPLTLVLVALDLIGFFSPDVQDVIRRVVEDARQHSEAAGPETAPGLVVLIASTHTHHGPDTLGLWGPDDRTRGVDDAYMADLKRAIAALIQRAVENLQPATGMRSGAVKAPGLAKNARNPAIVDEELTVLQFMGQNGQPLATLFDFPCHPEVLWERNPHITSDYPGVLRREVEARTGAPCIFFSGALGGMMTPDVQAHSFEECEAMGAALAQAGLTLLDGCPIVPVEVLSWRQQPIAARLTNILYEEAFQRQLLPDMRDAEGRVHSEVNLIKIGPAWFVAVPGELLPGLGLALKAGLKAAGAETAGIIGLANDELGYILPAEDFKYPRNPLRPGKHYEETNSIGREIGPAVMAAAQSLLGSE